MDKLKFSKNIKTGTLVAIKGGKVCRCGKNSTPVGIYTYQYWIKTIQPNGKIFSVLVPEGIQFCGPASCRTLQEATIVNSAKLNKEFDNIIKKL